MRAIVHTRAFGRLLLCATLSACAHEAPPPDFMMCGNVGPEFAYQYAVDDASRPQAIEISNTLSAISTSNPSLIWEGIPGASRVRVATWTGWDGYDAHVGEPVPLGREAWVTPAPDLQVACRALGLTGDALARRLEQLLGLPWDNHKTRVVELWVDPADMFRACLDAEVTDTQCQVEPPADITEEHRAWIDALRARSYGSDGETGYPWTQLGYTYDWATAGAGHNHVGLSEYVVRADASVHVVSVATTDAYCAVVSD